MGKTGRESLIRRVREFDTVSVNPDHKQIVDNVLNKHDENSARTASSGAGTFYLWVGFTYFLIIYFYVYG